MNKVLGFLVLMIALVACSRVIPTKIIPYSMIEYQPRKFIDRTEITVEQYAEFIFDGNQIHKPKKEIAKQFKYYEVFYPNKKQDSLFKAFGKIGYYQLPVVKEYFDTLKYSELRQILDFPISGITYEDALAYTNWRTKRYKENTTHTTKKIYFELPDSVVLPPLDTLYVKNKWKRDVPVVNFQESAFEVKRDAPNKKTYQTVGLSPVRTKILDQETNDVYDLYGNVAEMTSKKGIAYGGSYLSQSDELQNIRYMQPEPWLGFRCVGIVYE